MLRTIDDQNSIAEEEQDIESKSSPKSIMSKKSKMTIGSVKSINKVKGRDSVSIKTTSVLAGDKIKHVVLDESKARLTGRLKFYDDHKSYGFITIDSTGKDIFAHLGDMEKAGLKREDLIDSKNWKNYKFEFTSLTYIGKHNKSQKAVELILLK
jgi:'Cold-shock' DNA-binding domain